MGKTHIISNILSDLKKMCIPKIILKFSGAKVNILLPQGITADFSFFHTRIERQTTTFFFTFSVVCRSQKGRGRLPMGDRPRGRYAKRVRSPDVHRGGWELPEWTPRSVGGGSGESPSPGEGRVSLLLHHTQPGRLLHWPDGQRAQGQR